MHTYRKVDLGWQVVFVAGETYVPTGPIFDHEWEATALASFLNGGRYSPGEIEPLFVAAPAPDEDDDSTHPDRPKELDDYPVKRKRG